MSELEDREKVDSISESPGNIVTASDNEKMSEKNPLEYDIETLRLEDHLQKQIEEDRHYWLQNDAKLRVVHQGTLTYEDFRQIVASAHLKPLSKEDKDAWQKMPSRVLWNPINPNGDGENFKSTQSTLAGTENLSLSCNKEFPNPRNTTEFLKAWKGLLTDAEKFIFTNQLLNDQLDEDEYNTKSPCVMESIFHEEVPIQIFPDIIHILLNLTAKNIDETDKWKNSISALRTLEVVSKSKRFQLTMSFLSSKDRNEICLLLKNIEDNLNIDAPAEKSASYTQEKVLDLLEEVNNKYNTSNQR